MKMQKHEVLRHIADNMEAGRPEFEGLNTKIFIKQMPSHDWAQPVQPKLTHENNLDVFFGHTEFSLAPVMIVVNGIEVEEGFKGVLDFNKNYYVPDPNATDFMCASRWRNTNLEVRIMERGRVYLDKEKAVARGKLEASGTPF